MTLIRPFPAVALFFAVLVCVFTGSAQSVKRGTALPRLIDVINYRIGVRFDRVAKKVIGDTTVTFTPAAGQVAHIALDAEDMDFESITDASSGTALKYRTAGKKILVTLVRATSPRESVAIRFRYIATPRKGVYFQPPLIENGVEVRSAQIWTQGEPNEAHHWFPSVDAPDDKATSEQEITTNADETAIANGELLERRPNADGSITFRYRMPLPHSTYLTSFVVGKYAVVREKYGEIPLAYYVYPGSESIIPKAFGKTSEILRVYEQLTGILYPFNKYDQTIVANFSFGGMENITATTYADVEIFMADFDFAKSTIEDLVSHEAAHSWFGNLVTCRNWSELWLNEGFATYMEAAFREKTYGRANYLLKIRHDAAMFFADQAVNQKRVALFNTDADDLDKLFARPAVTYNKGGAVVHMLREQVGEKAFWAAVRNYLEKHRLGNVETADIEAAMEQASGQELGWFFRQWIYGSGYPKLSLKHAYDVKAKALKLTVTQTQKPEKNEPKAFRLSLDIVMETPDGVKTAKIDVTRRAETFTLPLSAAPGKLTVDPDDKVVLKSVKIEQ